MAKVRRTIRKVERRNAYFDEQTWPVNVALFVLGGFLVGAAIVYQSFEDPRWYANAWTAVVGVPLVIFAVMFTLRFVSNQLVRRGMQFSLVLSLLAHLIMLVASVELHIFNRVVSEVRQTREVVERRIPDFNPFQPQEQQDHERPIETPVPEMDSDPIERETAEETQAVPQPTPVPEPEPSANPAVSEQRQELPTPTPRMSDAPSQLSRSQATVTPNIARAAANPTSDQSASREPALEAASSAAQRQTTQRSPAAAMAQVEPRQATPSTAATRRREVDTPEPSPQSAPSLPRRVNTPTRVPVAQTTSPSTPSTAQRTTPDELQAAPTAAARRQTTSPRTERSSTEPTPVQPDVSQPAPTRREQPSPENVRLASTPTPQPTRQQRVTERPQAETVAQQASPVPSPNSANAAIQQSAPTAVTRANTSVDAQRAATDAPQTPQVTQPNRAQVARRQTEPTSRTEPTPTNPAQLTRRNTQPTAESQIANAAPADSPTATTRRSEGAELSAASTATTRSNTQRTEVARATGEPSSARATNPTSQPTTARANRANRPSDSPLVAQNPGSVGRRQTQPSPNPLQASANSVAESSSSPATATDTGLRAAASTLSRQTANSPGAADNSRPSQQNPTSSPTSQVAQASSSRASATETPSLQPAVAPSTPARSRLTGQLASPTPVDNPAVAKNTQSDGQQPSMQAAPTALSRSSSGTAGIGRSANLDRNEPAGESPSLVASASARRRESTRADDSMSELSDSQPSLVARNRAGAERPSSVLQADAAELATAAGANEPAELTASASASLTRSASDSAPADVNASKGESEVDIGPTRLVANSGADRAAGGGQPEMNFESQTQAVTRNSEGGEKTMSLAVDAVSPNVTAPEAEGGGEPQVEAPAATAVAQRMESGGDEPASGGPSQALAEGPSAEPNAADKIGALEFARAAAESTDEPGGAAGGAEGEEDEEDEEERARRLAAARQRAGGAPEVAIAGTEIAEQLAAPTGADAGGAESEPNAASANVARQSLAAGGLNRATSEERSEAASAPESQGGAAAVGETRVRRAEAVDAVAGVASPGGGSATPRRAATGPQFAADTQAEQLEMAAAEESGGATRSTPLAAQGVDVGRTASGKPGPSNQDPIGAVAAADVSDGAGVGPGASRASRTQTSQGGGPEIAASGETLGGPQRATAQLGGPAMAEVASPSELLASVDGAASGDQMAASLAAAATQIGRNSRAASDANLAAEVDAVEGPSGLVGAEFGNPGVANRRAQSDSIELATNAVKFRRQAKGGLPDFNTAAIAAAAPFQRRADRGRGETGGAKGTPGPETERAIESGLVFLSRYQLPDGSWSLKGINNEPVTYSSDGAATGLCLLAFQGAGYNHREHKYAEVVRSGLEFLIKNQTDDGSLFVPADGRSNQFVKLYTHGIATIALCEAYGMTQDPALREPAQKALNYIIDTQDKTYGGWRYTPGRFSDTSVTGWMMMALKSGELAGLDVDQDVYTRIQLWLNRSQASATQPHLYVYNPLAPNTPARRLGREPSKSMTAVGLLARLYTGWNRGNENMVAGAQYLAEDENLPAVGLKQEVNPLKKKRDTYYWYYGTQVMFHMGGDHWKQWNDKLHPLLIDSQEKSGDLAGSWDPYQPVPDRWGVVVGRLYVTTMNLLSLEVYYRHLPLYEDTAR